MDVKIGSRWADVIAELVASGRFASAEDVVSEGLALVAERERRVRELRESLVDALEEGGEYSSEEVMANVRERISQISARKQAAE